MLNVLSISLLGCDRVGCVRASKSIERQGFVAAESFAWQDGALEGWADASQSAVDNCAIRTLAGFACCVGPLWYRDRFGLDAPRLLMDEAGDASPPDEMALRGNFALFMREGPYCVLMNDALGFVRVYVSQDEQFYSTSWLATCAYAGRVELDAQAAVEYVLLGASHSDRTVAQGITKLPLGRAFNLAQRNTVRRFPEGISAGTRTPASFDEAAEEVSELLRTVFTEVTKAFPGRVRAALSGGFDSRLIVAGLLACGIRPELFVYGDSNSEDIPIARSVAGSAGIPLDVIDKNVLNRQLPIPDLERLVRSALFFDGLPTDGTYDSGADEQTRLRQTADGYLVLNGGGGEIFRNFFHLPDRAFNAIAIVRAFYRGFDPKVFRRAGGLGSYEDNLVSSIGQSLGMENASSRQMLSREQVELIYPLFRCHHWMSVNNSVGVRHGYYATPLVDLHTMRLASLLPLTWKNAGKLESCLIAKLHPGVARQPSTYGFRFSDGPHWQARFKEWTTCVRPPSARPYINAAGRRLRVLRVDPDMIARCRSLLPGEWQLDPVLNLERLPDNIAFARALAVEVAWRELVA